MAMGEPTIAEFSRMMQISTPNAAYKIGSLVKKGYVEKIQSTTDRREYNLRPTQKYIDYYNISYSYLHTVVERARERFSPEDCAKLEEMLTIVSDELMPELDLPKKNAKSAKTLPVAATGRVFCVSLLLLFIYHLDLALLPQHIGGQDAGKGGICQMSMTKAQTAFLGIFRAWNPAKNLYHIKIIKLRLPVTLYPLKIA